MAQEDRSRASHWRWCHPSLQEGAKHFVLDPGSQTIASEGLTFWIFHPLATLPSPHVTEPSRVGYPAGVQPRWVSGSPKDGQCRRRMRGQTPSLMPENGQPLWVWLNSKGLIKLYFYRDLLYDSKGTGAWHDFSSRKSLYRNIKKMYRKFYRFVHTKQMLFWPGGLSDKHT